MTLGLPPEFIYANSHLKWGVRRTKAFCTCLEHVDREIEERKILKALPPSSPVEASLVHPRPEKAPLEAHPGLKGLRGGADCIPTRHSTGSLQHPSCPSNQTALPTRTADNPIRTGTAQRLRTSFPGTFLRKQSRRTQGRSTVKKEKHYLRKVPSIPRSAILSALKGRSRLKHFSLQTANLP